MKHKYPRIQKVIVSQERRGCGTVKSLYRIVTKVHSLKGKFIAEWDPFVECQPKDEK